jgi:hypothetical protein
MAKCLSGKRRLPKRQVVRAGMPLIQKAPCSTHRYTACQNGTQPKGSYVFVGWVHICPQARQLNHWIVPTAPPPSRSLLPQPLQNRCGGGRRAGCGTEVFGEIIRRSKYAGNCRLNNVLFGTVASSRVKTLLTPRDGTQREKTAVEYGEGCSLDADVEQSSGGAKSRTAEGWQCGESARRRATTEAEWTLSICDRCPAR